MTARLLFALLLFNFMAQPVDAQVSPPIFQPAMDINVAASIYRGNPNTYDKATRAPEQNPNFNKADFVRALTFKLNKAATKANLQAFADEQRRANPATGAELDKLFASQDVLGLIGQEMQRYGLSQNNVADAFAVHWIGLWQVANQDYSDTTIASVQAVSKQARLAFSTTPDFIGISDEIKQQMAESYMVYAGILGASAEASKSDPQKQAAFVRSAKQTALHYGVDLNAIALTEKGFITASGN